VKPRMALTMSSIQYQVLRERAAAKGRRADLAMRGGHDRVLRVGEPRANGGSAFRSMVSHHVDAGGHLEQDLLHGAR
jgi:hypothetical protein